MRFGCFWQVMFWIFQQNWTWCKLCGTFLFLRLCFSKATFANLERLYTLIFESFFHCCPVGCFLGEFKLWKPKKRFPKLSTGQLLSPRRLLFLFFWDKKLAGQGSHCLSDWSCVERFLEAKAGMGMVQWWIVSWDESRLSIRQSSLCRYESHLVFRIITSAVFNSYSIASNCFLVNIPIYNIPEVLDEICYV